MSTQGHGRDRQMRQRIAMQAARLIAEHGIHDYQAAKRKAAQSLGVPDTRNLPRNSEIEAALIDYQRLFKSASHPRHLRALRQAAVEAMRFFSDYRPRLVGAVLRGTASEHSDVCLHLFADSPERVRAFLQQHRIPFEERERRLRCGAEQWEICPVFRFGAGQANIDLTVFPEAGMKQAPLDPLDGRPMERASLSTVERLLEEDEFENLLASL
jgi:hypothetical protein